MAAVKFAPRLKELRIHLCQTSAASQGVRDFITKEYVGLKKANPKVPILIRECSGITPKIWARHEFGQESSVGVGDKNSSQVMDEVLKLAVK
ncbi:NADH dehydrogenase [ubiquinone] 1 alpha subcomplex subunit 2-like [Watersipora subatra]|uniref:NADH dehydrogenase [ubiquinone] 1 alpha subcomplex subunit 2-like n=1 Tax=Watersipora subatra TaxID=2589382 RepID=UPI00355BFB93